MNRQFIPLLLLASAALMGQSRDLPGYKDPQLFTRLPNYNLDRGYSFEEKQYEQFKFGVAKGKSVELQTVEGRYTHYDYFFDRSAGAQASRLQIIRNYQNAAARIGGKIILDDGQTTTIQVIRDGKEAWVAVVPEADGLRYQLHIIERDAMKQDVTANAQVFEAQLKESGHVAVPGIFFDFGKSDVKPESAAALTEIVKVLQASPSLKVWIVGHTDSVGSADSNLALSRARAASVVQALAAMGIDAGRLSPFGAGPFAPVASNATDEGRSRNRRVELVQQ